MKKWLCLFISLIVGGISAGVYAQDHDADRTAIIEAIEDFAQGADSQDPERVAASLHAQSWQYMPAPDGVRAFNQEQYLGLLKAKRIGGTPREMKVESVDITEGYIATARVQLQKGERVFLHHIGLMKVGEAWQIMSILTLVGTDNE